MSTHAESSPPRGGSGAMFDGIARRYDLLNRINSLGLDQSWRRRAVEALALCPEERVLDLATGTGDLLLELDRRAQRLELRLELVGLDPSEGMLEVARAKLGARARLVRGEAEALPFEDERFDALTMAFGIRNVADRPRALAEMRRVLRPGGRLAILELAEPRRGLLGAAARFHVHHVVPRLGALLSGGSAYRYLQSSIEAFPPAEVFVETMKAAGLEVRRAEPLTFGACVLFVAERGGRS